MIKFRVFNIISIFIRKLQQSVSFCCLMRKIAQDLSDYYHNFSVCERDLAPWLLYAYTLSVPQSYPRVPGSSSLMHLRCAPDAYSMGTRCVLDAYSMGTRCVLDVYSVRTRCVLGAYSMGTRWVLDAYSMGTQCVLDGYSTKNPFELNTH